MAGKAAIVAKARALNAKREVRYAGSRSAAQFWEAAHGCFLISGGTERSRSRMLCEKLALELARGGMPTILLTTSAETEGEMIRRMGQMPADRTLRVTSSRYPTYLFFRGWDDNDIARFLTAAAVLLNYRGDNLPVYIQAFAEILSLYYEPDLSSMLALAAMDDEEIARIGEGAGASHMTVNNIRNLPNDGRLFRTMLRQVKSAFSPLAAPEPEDGYSLAGETAASGVLYLINARSHVQDLLDLYFAEELSMVLERQTARLVLEGLDVNAQNPLQKVLLREMTNGIETDVSAEYAADLLGNNAAARFGVRVVLTDGAHTDEALAGELKSLGTYTHYEVVPAAPPAPPFSLMAALFMGKHYALNAIPNHPKVQPQDVRGCEAVLKGMSGDWIDIVRNMQ